MMYPSTQNSVKTYFPAILKTVILKLISRMHDTQQTELTGIQCSMHVKPLFHLHCLAVNSENVQKCAALEILSHYIQYTQQ